MHSSYITSAAKPEQLPRFGLPEMAFIGRSNCGKSSLLNAFLGTKGLARTSGTPGRTQMVNFFKLNEELMIADLPGYGFSKVPLETKRSWQALLDAYFRRQDIVLLAFLVDIRRELDEEDTKVLQWLSEIRPTAMLLTKCDKLSKLQQNNAIKKAADHIAKNKIKIWQEVMAVSSMKKIGITEFRDAAFAEIGISKVK